MRLERLAIVTVSGVLIWFLGYMIKEREVMWLIAGYDPNDVHDAGGLAEFIGGWLYLVAVLTVGIGIADYYGFEMGWIAYGIAVLVISIWLIRGSNRYTR